MIHIVTGNNTFNINNENKLQKFQGDSMLNEVKFENRYCGLD